MWVCTGQGNVDAWSLTPFPAISNPIQPIQFGQVPPGPCWAVALSRRNIGQRTNGSVFLLLKGGRCGLQLFSNTQHILCPALFLFHCPRYRHGHERHGEAASRPILGRRAAGVAICHMTATFNSSTHIGLLLQTHTKDSFRNQSCKSKQGSIISRQGIGMYLRRCAQGRVKIAPGGGRGVRKRGSQVWPLGFGFFCRCLSCTMPQSVPT